MLETRAVHMQDRKNTFCLLFAKMYNFDLCLLMQLAQYLCKSEKLTSFSNVMRQNIMKNHFNVHFTRVLLRLGEKGSCGKRLQP